jgi:hypothetical protein
MGPTYFISVKKKISPLKERDLQKSDQILRKIKQAKNVAHLEEGEIYITYNFEI